MFNEVELLKQAHKMVKKESYLLLGQALYIVCYEKYQKQVAQIVETSSDCFYDNKKIEKFLNVLEFLVEKENMK
jgi:CHASE3 domain sensor protein